jgi:hypothetical protein
VTLIAEVALDKVAEHGVKIKLTRFVVVNELVLDHAATPCSLAMS